MDALFGLPRKKSSGMSISHPLLESLMFHDQLSVDEFVSETRESTAKSDVSK